MDRIEKVREYVDQILLNMADAEERRCAYLHLYGVAQAAAMIAMKRKENVELAVIAGMLHDIYAYKNMDPIDHAHKGAALAGEILCSLQLFSKEEIDMICDAVYNHSNKNTVNTSFNEVLIDSDVFQHCMYNPLGKIADHEKIRFEKLKKEFGII